MNKSLIYIGFGLILVANFIGFINGDFTSAYKWSLLGSLVMGGGVIKWRLKFGR